MAGLDLHGHLAERPLHLVLLLLHLAAGVALALPSAAVAQEAPICLESGNQGEKLSDGVDHWTGTDKADKVTGLRGKDVLKRRGGNDLLTGGTGSDLIFAGSGADTLVGGAGDDGLIGQEGADSIAGGEGNDRIYADISDTVDGGAGYDIMYMVTDYMVTDAALTVDLGAIHAQGYRI